MRTLAKPGSGKLTEKRSRFLAFAYPVSREEEIEGLLAELRRRFHEARHIAYAWRLPGRERADDAGEPAGSAGRPILQLLQGEGLEGVLVAVVRYFGGVKLGVGGLARAYRAAARLALKDAEVVEREPEARLKVRVPLNKVGEALARIGRLGGRVLAQSYDGAATLEVSLPRSRAHELTESLGHLGEVEVR